MTAGPADAADAEARIVAAGRAAGYCWAPVPGDRGRCTWPPGHDEDLPHRNAYDPDTRAEYLGAAYSRDLRTSPQAVGPRS